MFQSRQTTRQDKRYWQAVLLICPIFGSETKSSITPRALPRAISSFTDDKVFYYPLIPRVWVDRRALPLLLQNLQMLQKGFNFRLQMQILDLLVSLIKRLHQCHQAGVVSWGSSWSSHELSVINRRRGSDETRWTSWHQPFGSYFCLLTPTDIVAWMSRLVKFNVSLFGVVEF